MINCNSHREVKLLEQGMKVIERVLKRRMRAFVDFDDFMSGKGSTDALFLVRRLLEEH